MRRLGYIRTSTDKQLTARQVMQLEEACDEVFIEDGVSAVKKKRLVYDGVIRELEAGDVFVVCALDRAFRSALDALSELDKLEKRDIQFKSLAQNFDTTTPDGKLLYTVAAGLAEWERQILSERTKQGLEAARRRGKTLGRPRKLSEAQIELARRTLEVDVYSTLTQLAHSFRVHEITLTRALNEEP